MGRGVEDAKWAKSAAGSCPGFDGMGAGWGILGEDIFKPLIVNPESRNIHQLIQQIVAEQLPSTDWIKKRRSLDTVRNGKTTLETEVEPRHFASEGIPEY